MIADRSIRHLPVLDGGKPVGVMSQCDPMAVLAGALNEPQVLEQLVEASELVRSAVSGGPNTASGTSAASQTSRSGAEQEFLGPKGDGC